MSKKVCLIYSLCATAFFLQAQSISMPTMPTVTAPTFPEVPVVTYPSSITSSSVNQQNFNNASTTNTNQSSNISSSTNKALTDSAISSLAASALQQLVGSSSLDSSSLNSSNIENLLSEQLQTPLSEEKTTIDSLDTITSKSYGRILRCIVNNNDRHGAFKNYWISQPDRTGAFLLTGLYITEANTTDIFYMYFIPENLEQYKVSISCSDTNNTLFPTLVALTKENPLTAKRTGNLVTIKINETEMQIDMLLSINFTTKDEK